MKGVILDETSKASVAREKQADRVAEQWCLWEDAALLPVLGGEGFEKNDPLFFSSCLWAWAVKRCPWTHAQHDLSNIALTKASSTWSGRNALCFYSTALLWTGVTIPVAIQPVCYLWDALGYGDFSHHLTSVGSEVSFFDCLETFLELQPQKFILTSLEVIRKMGHGKGRLGRLYSKEIMSRLWRAKRSLFTQTLIYCVRVSTIRLRNIPSLRQSELNYFIMCSQNDIFLQDKEVKGCGWMQGWAVKQESSSIASLVS